MTPERLSGFPVMLPGLGAAPHPVAADAGRCTVGPAQPTSDRWAWAHDQGGLVLHRMPGGRGAAQAQGSLGAHMHVTLGPSFLVLGRQEAILPTPWVRGSGASSVGVAT